MYIHIYIYIHTWKCASMEESCKGDWKWLNAAAHMNEHVNDVCQNGDSQSNGFSTRNKQIQQPGWNWGFPLWGPSEANSIPGLRNQKRRPCRAGWVSIIRSSPLHWIYLDYMAISWWILIYHVIITVRTKHPSPILNMVPFQERITQRWSSTIFEQTEGTWKFFGALWFLTTKDPQRKWCAILQCVVWQVWRIIPPTCKNEPVATYHDLYYNWCWTGLASLPQ